jgi:hypothetical protein
MPDSGFQPALHRPRARLTPLGDARAEEDPAVRARRVELAQLRRGVSGVAQVVNRLAGRDAEVLQAHLLGELAFAPGRLEQHHLIHEPGRLLLRDGEGVPRPGPDLHLEVVAPQRSHASQQHDAAVLQPRLELGLALRRRVRVQVHRAGGDADTAHQAAHLGDSGREVRERRQQVPRRLREVRRVVAGRPGDRQHLVVGRAAQGCRGWKQPADRGSHDAVRGGVYCRKQAHPAVEEGAGILPPGAPARGRSPAAAAGGPRWPASPADARSPRRHRASGRAARAARRTRSETARQAGPTRSA